MNTLFDFPSGSYTDAKGRLRWQQNDWLAEQLKQLGEFLVIGGYEESHATRYPKLAYAISRHPEPIEVLWEEKRLGSIPGVGATIQGIIGEFLTTGSCAKKNEWAQHTPLSIMEVAAIPGLGAKTVKVLYQEHDVKNLDDLKAALDKGVLQNVPGLGRKTLTAIQQHLANR
jgi:DNA polymerase (family 10)